MNLSDNLTLAEATKSNTATRFGIDNTPNDEQKENLKKVALNVFQPMRDYFRVPIAVTSGFRSKALNKKLGGSKTSDHMEGLALDLDADVFNNIENKDIFNFIKDNLEFKQLIWEFGDDENPAWVHVSYEEGNNKGEILRAYKSNGKTSYSFA